MRSWGSRPDTFVCDEPLYAHYLSTTGINHPGREQIIRYGETDWRQVVRWLTGPVPDGKAIFYQKHMAHHLLPDMMGNWLGSLRNALLIRDPQEMLISFAKVMPAPRLDDTGLQRQIELYESVRKITGESPPVIDARDVLENPEVMLRRLCDKLRVAFRPEMLRWRRGRRATDGLWAPYWYANVENSTGFKEYEPPSGTLPSRLQDLEHACRSLYNELYRHRIEP